MKNSKGWGSSAVIISFWIFSAWYLYIGGILSQTLSFTSSLAALFVANSILVLLFVFYSGTGKKKDVLFEEAFGTAGAHYFASLLPALTQIGWYAVVVEIGGGALALLLGFEKNSIPFRGIVALYGALTIWIALGGLKRISRVSWVSVPAMILFSVWGGWAVFSSLGFSGIHSYTPQNPGTFLHGVQILLVSFISASVTIPDFLSHLGSKKKIFLASVWGLLPATLLVGGLGAAFAIAGKTFDVLATLQILGGSLFIYLLLSVDNLCGAQAVFPVGMGLASVFRKKNEENSETSRKFWTMFGGTVSIALAVIGIVGKIELWLTMLGTIFPGLLGVVLANQYFVKGDFSKRRFYLPAIICWIVGIATSFAPLPVPAIFSFFISFLSFSFIQRIKER